LGSLLEHPAAVPGAKLHPAGHGTAGGFQGATGFGTAAVGHLDDDLLGGGVDDAQGAAVVGSAPLAVDIHALEGSGCCDHASLLLKQNGGSLLPGEGTMQ